MIKKFIQRLLGQSGAAQPPAPALPPPAPPLLGTRREIPAAEHGIDPSLLAD